MNLLIEPINTFDMPGFYLNGTLQAVYLIDQVGASNLFLQYDICRAQRMEGEMTATLTHHLALIKHLDDIGCNGYVGCEYKPAYRGLNDICQHRSGTRNHESTRPFAATFDAAVQAALPRQRMAAYLPAPPRGRTLVLGTGKVAGAMALALDELWPIESAFCLLASLGAFSVGLGPNEEGQT